MLRILNYLAIHLTDENDLRYHHQGDYYLSNTKELMTKLTVKTPKKGIYDDPTKFMEQYKHGIQFTSTHTVDVNYSTLVSYINESYHNGNDGVEETINNFICLLILKLGQGNYDTLLKEKLDRVEEIFVSQKRDRIIQELEGDLTNV